jgi:electron transfer flavoprotein alpha/beta subunit
VKRKVEGGVERIRGALPAVLTVELDLAKPRRAPLPQLIQSLRTTIPVWNAEAIDGETEKLGLKGSPTWVRRIFAPPLKKGGPAFDARENPQDAIKGCLRTLLADETFATQFWSRWERGKPMPKNLKGIEVAEIIPDKCIDARSVWQNARRRY